jgi:hypothetical protein
MWSQDLEHEILKEFARFQKIYVYSRQEIQWEKWRRRRMASHTEQEKKAALKRRLKTWKKEGYDRECVECKKTFKLTYGSGSKSQQKYCTPVCRKKAHTKNQKPRPPRAPKVKISHCRFCGNQIEYMAKPKVICDQVSCQRTYKRIYVAEYRKKHGRK